MDSDFSSGRERFPNDDRSGSTGPCFWERQTTADTLRLCGHSCLLERLQPEPSESTTPVAGFADSTRFIDGSSRWYVSQASECPPSSAKAARSAVSNKTATRDDQSTRFFVALYELCHWLGESSALLGLHPDSNPSATPEELTEMFELWAQ
ncbi:hypothetical protein PC128_g14481 [Phytophthora cactorum]|nr:hypothetical protein PC128_g14481 [Phytophthora cactorum]